MPFNPFSAVTAKLFGGLAVLALVFGGVQTWRLSSAQEALEDKRNELATCEARHAVTRQSVADLELSLGRYVGAGQASRVSQLASLDAQSKNSKELQRQADMIRAEMAEMEPGPGCETPDSIRGADL